MQKQLITDRAIKEALNCKRVHGRQNPTTFQQRPTMSLVSSSQIDLRIIEVFYVETIHPAPLANAIPPLPEEADRR
jgi:hypothetical protein